VHDPLNVADLVHYELRQRRESGYDVSRSEADLAATPTADHGRLEATYPGDPEPLTLSRPSWNELADRILGGWQGRIAGCNLGKPVEDGDFWTPDRIRAYLELAGAHPLRDFIPAPDPMPEGFRLPECWPETTRGHIHGAARDDDIDYSILNLRLLEQYGFDLTPDRVLAFLPYSRLAEHGLRSLPTEHPASA